MGDGLRRYNLKLAIDGKINRQLAMGQQLIWSLLSIIMVREEQYRHLFALMAFGFLTILQLEN